MNIVVGLGNPDQRFNLTKHNAGFVILDEIIGSDNWEFNKKFNAYIYQEANHLFVKPQTYMNLSGFTVNKILNFYNIIPKKMGILHKKNFDLKDQLTVIHDDLDIDLGKYKTSYDSSSAGHKGIDSIIGYIKTKKFTRIRIGINTPNRSYIPTEKYVLQKFQEEELSKIKEISQKIKPLFQ